MVCRCTGRRRGHPRARALRAGTFETGDTCDSGMAIRTSPSPANRSSDFFTPSPASDVWTGAAFTVAVARQHVGVDGKSGHVEDQDRRPSPMMVAPANTDSPGQRLPQRLDDDLLGVFDAVDDESELATVDLQDDDVGRASVGAVEALRRLDCECRARRRATRAAAARRGAGRPAHRDYLHPASTASPSRRTSSRTLP